MSSVILTNWTVYYADDVAAGAGMKQIKWTGTTGTTSINALYTALMDLFDNASNNDASDSIPMKAITPTLYEIGISDAGDTQPWFIDPESVKHLTDGGLNTSRWKRSGGGAGDAGIVKITRSGTNIVAGDVGATISNGTSTGWLLHVSGSNLWIRPTSNSATHDWTNTGVSVICNTHTDTQTGAAVSDESIWSNIYSLGTLESNTQLYIYQNGSAITPWWSTDHIDILVLVKDFGTVIDSGNLTVFARQYSKLYDHYLANVASGGRTPIPLATAPDTNNTTSSVTVSGYNNITFTFGSINRDLNNGDGLQPYDVEIDCASRPLAQVYEYLKYVTREGSVITLNGSNGEQYLAAQAGYTPIKTAPFGTFAGGKFFGARGVWLKNVPTTDTNKYELIDANNVRRVPPQSITLTVDGLAVNDQVGVFRATGDNNTIDKSMFTIDPSTPTGASTTEVWVNESIPNDTPVSGSIRLVHRTAAGVIEFEERLTYSAWSNATQGSGYSTFTVESFNSTLDSTDTAYVPYLDVTADATSESVSLIYVANRFVTARVRKSGILPFMSKYQITNANLTITAVRATDTIA